MDGVNSSRNAPLRRRRPAAGDANPHEQLFWEMAGPGSQRLLLEAALACFAAKGFHGTSTRDIAKRARMSPAAIYAHYKSKEELLFIIARVVTEAMLADLQAAVRGVEDPRERLRLLVRTHAEFHATMAQAVRVASFELHALSPARRRTVLEVYERTRKMIEDCVKAGGEVGMFSVDQPKVVVNAIISMSIAIARWYSPSGPLSAEELGASYGQLALRMVADKKAPA